MNMPAAVKAYFTADGGNDPDTLVAAFSDEAVVLDEGGRHQGRQAIRTWWIAAKDASQHVTEPLAATTEGDRTMVHARVSGAFAGSPIVLGFDFLIEGDAIIKLEIK